MSPPRTPLSDEAMIEIVTAPRTRAAREALSAKHGITVGVIAQHQAGRTRAGLRAKAKAGILRPWSHESTWDRQAR